MGMQTFPNSAIKSVQRGTVSATGSTVNVTISPVNTAKAFVNMPDSYGTYGTSFYVYAQLTSSTNLAINTNGNSTVSWEVIEYV